MDRKSRQFNSDTTMPNPNHPDTASATRPNPNYPTSLSDEEQPQIWQYDSTLTNLLTPAGEVWHCAVKRPFKEYRRHKRRLRRLRPQCLDKLRVPVHRDKSILQSKEGVASRSCGAKRGIQNAHPHCGCNGEQRWHWMCRLLWICGFLIVVLLWFLIGCCS